MRGPTIPTFTRRSRDPHGDVITLGYKDLTSAKWDPRFNLEVDVYVSTLDWSAASFLLRWKGPSDDDMELPIQVYPGLVALPLVSTSLHRIKWPVAQRGTPYALQALNTTAAVVPWSLSVVPSASYGFRSKEKENCKCQH